MQKSHTPKTLFCFSSTYAISEAKALDLWTFCFLEVLICCCCLFCFSSSFYHLMGTSSVVGSVQNVSVGLVARRAREWASWKLPVSCLLRSCVGMHLPTGRLVFEGSMSRLLGGVLALFQRYTFRSILIVPSKCIILPPKSRWWPKTGGGSVGGRCLPLCWQLNRRRSSLAHFCEFFSKTWAGSTLQKASCQPTASGNSQPLSWILLLELGFS